MSLSRCPAHLATALLSLPCPNCWSPALAGVLVPRRMCGVSWGEGGDSKGSEGESGWLPVCFLRKDYTIYTLQLHIGLNRRKGACVLQCGLGPGMEKASIDFDNLHINEGSKFLLPEIGKSPFY